MRTLVVIPAFNEEGSIASTVEELRRVAPQLDYVVINDGSTDSTKHICQSRHYPLIDLPVNLGLSAAFQTGLRYARREHYDAAVQFDADGQHRPEYLSVLIAVMEKTGADIVIGSRFVTQPKPTSLRMIGSRLIASFVRLTTGVTISDPTSGMRLYRSTVFDAFCDFDNFGPEPDSVAYLIHKGASIQECQVSMRERTAGTSYLSFTRSIEYMFHVCTSILFLQWFRG